MNFFGENEYEYESRHRSERRERRREDRSQERFEEDLRRNSRKASRINIDNDNDNDNRNDSVLKNRNLNLMRVDLSGNAISRIWIKTEADSDLDSDLKTVLRGGKGGRAKK